MDNTGTLRRARWSAIDKAQQDGKDETTKMTYSIERDALDCPICFMPFEDQVYMCKNGHAACSSCCVKMNTMCPCCNEPIGDIRCRPVEKVLAAMSAPCKFSTRASMGLIRASGCMETVGYTEKLSHEASCPHAPCNCPFDGCNYQGSWLYRHIQDEHATDAVVMGCPWDPTVTAVTLHKSKPFDVLLHRGCTRVFLLLNGDNVLSGRSLSLVCVSPPPSPNCELLYKIELGAALRGPGELARSASGPVPCVRRLEGFEAKAFLYVPDYYWGSSGTVSVTVHV